MSYAVGSNNSKPRANRAAYSKVDSKDDEESLANPLLSGNVKR